MTASFRVLCAGYANDKVASTVSLACEGDVVAVIDPGMVASTAAILEPLAAAGFEPADVTDVILSHHHPDHTVKVGLFPDARVHDHWAIYHLDSWTERAADGFCLSASIRLLETPGHTAQDITTLVETDDGLIACTHLWWSADGPELDPLASDQELLEHSRQVVLGLRPHLIVPGHGEPFSLKAD